ncbi:hypothetical protein FA13DRAFT_1732281 [Coprinellus micaceus]|uniref:Uncharacterized protein n=1 Tax=Coprinellus micaceus TaxID=71717 RepID=A0A4Y7TCU6_COPMI|nr:hypothetical protein FA13DRAFT_1732940 [Coprinellus micaceus]TEB31997.1 hypothetical protein FA13DRAFT_1732281 [Coprinellus micaceus]
MTAMHFGRGLDNQTSGVRAPDGYTSTHYFSRQSSQQGTASDPQTRASAPIQPSRSASEGFRPSIPPQAPNMSGFATNAQFGQGYTASAQGLQSHDGRVPLGRDYYRRLFPSVLASQSILPAQYFEEAGPTHGQPHRKSNEIPPPEPDAPYTPPNAL